MTSIGIGVVTFLFNREGDVLIGKRKGSHGAGTWSLPGGKLEFMKSAQAQMSTELEEETGLILPAEKFSPLQWLDNIWMDPDKGQQHWITLFTTADYESTTAPRVMEPDKCEGWVWADPFTLRGGRYKLFHPLEQYLVKFPIGNLSRYQIPTGRTRCF